MTVCLGCGWIWPKCHGCRAERGGKNAANEVRPADSSPCNVTTLAAGPSERCEWEEHCLWFARIDVFVATVREEWSTTDYWYCKRSIVAVTIICVRSLLPHSGNEYIYTSKPQTMFFPLTSLSRAHGQCCNVTRRRVGRSDFVPSRDIHGCIFPAPHRPTAMALRS